MFVNVWLILVFFAAVSAIPDGKTRLRVMTIDAWNFRGTHAYQGPKKLAKHIQLVDADFVAIQEEGITGILSELGSDYRGYVFDEILNPPGVSDFFTGVITKHEIDYSTLIRTPNSVGFKINIRNSTKSVHFYSLHLERHYYGPYMAMEGNSNQMLDYYERKRVDQVQALIGHPGFQAQVQSANTGGIPLIVAGSFNSASHLDWIESTKHLHYDYVHEWPSTKLISDNASLTDSFRVIYPDPLAVPGNTWWTGNLKDTTDRIDYIFFNSPKLTPVDSFIYSGCSIQKPYPNHRNNDFPSQHYAVVSDFLYE